MTRLTGVSSWSAGKPRTRNERLWCHLEAAPDRRAITEAQAAIDRLLVRDPFGSGQELSEGLFVIEVAPLRAYYTVDEQQHVWVDEVRVIN